MQHSGFVPPADQASQNINPGWHNYMGVADSENVTGLSEHESATPDPILHQLRQGSEAAFNSIYWENSTHLLHFAISVVQSREVAEDLCADIFCKFWERRDRFTHVRDVKAYLFISLRNAALNYLKSKAIRNSQKESYLTKLEDPHWDPLEDPNEVRSEYKKRILKAVHSLPAQCKQVFILSYFEELKISEIATRMGIHRNTVKKHKYRALQFLRKALQTNPILVHFALIIYHLFRP